MVRKERAAIDPAAVLRVVGHVAASFEAELTPEAVAAMRERNACDEGSSIVYAADEREQAMSDFEMLAAADALDALARDIETVIQQRMEEAYRQGLEVYYKAEELARDPGHAHLIPHVEAMRRAHEEQYGRPIPPRRLM